MCVCVMCVKPKTIWDRERLVSDEEEREGGTQKDAWDVRDERDWSLRQGGGVTREADCRSSGAEASMKTLAQKQDNDIWHPLGRDGCHELTYLSTANKNNWDRQQEGRRNDDIDWPLRTSALRRKGEEDAFNRRECPRSQLKCDRLVTTCSAERTPNLPDELYCNAIISL